MVKIKLNQILALVSVVFLFTSLFGSEAQAATTFSTTFPTASCADWNQSMGLSDANVCVSGDGIGGWGGWITSSHPNGDEITAAANNPLNSGKGFRHWRCDGQNCNGGGLGISLPTGQSEVWMRFYMRHQLGFAWSGGAPQYEKDVYWGTGASGEMNFGFNGGGVGFRTYNDSRQNVASSITWSSINGGSTSDGNFHCFEYHIKMDTNGSNGIGEIWVDGVQALSINNINWGTSPNAWGDFILGDNQNNPNNSGDRYTDYDDIVISNSARVGCLGGTPPPPPPPTPTPVAGDINLDHIVNSLDYSILSSQWFTANVQSDLNNDSIVNGIDFSILNSNWFKTW